MLTVCRLLCGCLLCQPGGKAGKDSKAKAKAISQSARAGLQFPGEYALFAIIEFVDAVEKILLITL